MDRYLFFIIILILLNQCGFKSLDSSLSTLNIKNVEIEGYNKVNFFVKNEILNKLKNKNEGTPVDIKIITDKKKEVSEKNIRNEITKYRITLDTKVVINNIFNEKSQVFNISSYGDYRVESSSISTAKNLNNLEQKLSNEISNKIKQKLFLLNNDL